MLKYVDSPNSQQTTLSDSSPRLDNTISTRIVVSDTDVQHSGTYNCEPGAAPVASVNVHVLDGKTSCGLFYAKIKPAGALTRVPRVPTKYEYHIV